MKATEGFANAHEDAKGLQVEKTMKQVTLHFNLKLVHALFPLLDLHLYFTQWGVLLTELLSIQGF